MSKLNLYESQWTNLVFENKNKDYGAYQLRQQTTKTSIHSLSLGVLLCTALIILPGLLTHQKESATSILPEIKDRVIQLTDIYSEQIKEEVAAAPALPEAQQQQPTQDIDKKQLINPTVVSAAQATPVTEFTLTKNNPTDSTTETMGTSGSATVNGSGVEGGTGIGSGTSTSNTNSTEVVMTELLDKKPQFPGGIEKFYRYISNNFTSPTLEEGKKVRIFVSFVVEKDGSMSSIKVLNNPGAGLEKEAIRVLKSIKSKWTPGMVNSTAVRTAYNLPIVIQID
ncbi:MAG TPA: energy transducer TonB [Flavobacterium sp.]|nr:energy transducer TonB [Flavobacterium sp.]